MANKETSSWSDFFQPRIGLPHVDCEKRKFRFVSLLPDNQIEIRQHYTESAGIPLFIGCDVLSGCCQAPSNYARIHARYSKLGLATKLVLKDFRIEGLKKGSAFWFYNIEGLFRVTFECQDRKIQRSIITNLTNLWIERFNDKGLKDEYTVEIKKESLLNSWISVSVSPHSDIISQRETTQKQISVDPREKTDEITSVHKWETTLEHKTKGEINKETNSFEKVELEHLTHSSNNRRHEDFCVKFADLSKVKSNKLEERKCLFSKVDVGVQTEDIDFGKQVIKIILPNSNIKNSKLINNRVEKTKQNNMANSSHLSSHVVDLNSETDIQARPNGECLKCSSMRKENQNYDQCFKNLLLDMKHFVDNFASCRTESWHNMRTISELLQYEYRYSGNSNHITGFPFKMIDLYLKDIQNMKNKSDTVVEETMTSRDIFLCTISRWLGKEYLKFQSLILDKVEKFKTDYITCIDDLPQSETIVNIIFPKCMQELLKTWIGFEEVLHESSNVFEEDHSYIPSYKKAKYSEENYNSTPSKIPYPLIQLILEFANKALVSGVAHVVYSKVCQAI